MFFLESLIQELTVSFSLSRDLKVCVFELSIALQGRFSDCSAVFMEVNKESTSTAVIAHG